MSSEKISSPIPGSPHFEDGSTTIANGHKAMHFEDGHKTMPFEDGSNIIAENGHKTMANDNITMAADGNKTTPNGNKTIPNGNQKPATAPKHDMIARGVYRPNPLGTATFIGLRVLDPLLQYSLLGPSHWGEALLSRLSIPSIPLLDHALTTSPDITIGTSSLLSSPTALSLPLPRLLLLLMATGSSLKQIFWLVSTSKEEFTPSAACAVSAYNTTVNSLASLLLLAIPTSASLSTPRMSITLPGLGALILPLPMAIGTALYIAGISLETASEVHRRRFKDDPANKGKICDTGLWAQARHVNYSGYTLWRTGYALAAGGWLAGAVVAAWHAWGFWGRSIRQMEEYMSGKYKEKWLKYKQDVPWTLCPGII